VGRRIPCAFDRIVTPAHRRSSISSGARQEYGRVCSQPEGEAIRAVQGSQSDPFGTAELRRRVLDAWAASPARFREDANAER